VVSNSVTPKGACQNLIVQIFDALFKFDASSHGY
jgi:hypothetical protein